jgi:hypothetical protein
MMYDKFSYRTVKMNLSEENSSEVMSLKNSCKTVYSTANLKQTNHINNNEHLDSSPLLG